MSNFATLKKSSGNIDRLVKEIDNLNKPGSAKKEVDERFWKPEPDKTGNGMAVIRFLPAAEMDGDGPPWVRVFDHFFKGPTGKYYVENSLTTIKQEDPVSEYNKMLWNSTNDDNSPQRKQVREQKRGLTYYSNIYVITDAKNPANEGKVFLFKYGKKIFDKIQDCFHPPFDEHGRSSEDPKYDPTNAFNPFDLWKGANFKLRMRMVDGYRSYEASTFDTPGPLHPDDAILEKIWKQEHSIQQFVHPSQFKPYEELKKKLDDVLGLGSTMAPSVSPGVRVTEKPVEKKSMAAISDDEDDDLEQFKSLLND